MEIEGYENYLIYDDGKVSSKRFKNRFLKPATSIKGYKNIVLCKNGKGKNFTIHRLVALHYIPNPENKPEVDHISRDPSNNHVDNLRWATSLENNQNRGMPNTNTSGVKNIRFNKQREMWYYEKVINKIRHAKFFKTFEDAVEYKTKFETIHK